MGIKVVFDANPLVNGQLSGVGHYTKGLIQSLADTFPDDLELVGHYFNFLGRKTNLNILPKAPNISYAESRLIPGKLLNICRRLGFQPPIELFFRKSFDIALYPNFVSLPSLRGKPSAIILHDLCYYDIPEYVHEKNRRFLTRFVPQAINRARLIICVSEFTKTRVEEIYKPSDKFFVVTHNPPMPPLVSGKESLVQLGIKKKYILHVGTLEPRKNIRGLVESYIRLPEKVQAEYSLVLAGGTGWYMDEDLKFISELQQQNKDIQLVGYIDNQQRAALYTYADLFVLASFYEGFGMPILEAMTYDCPCALSDIAVFHEVAGNAGVYFDPNSPDDMATTMVAVLNNVDMSSKLKQSGREQLKLYDWTIVAKKVHEKIAGVLNE